MAKRRPFDGAEADRAESLVRLMLDYLAELARRNYTAGTIETRRRHLRLFAEWAAEREVRDCLHVTRAVIERYQRYLFHYRQANGEPLAINYQIQRVVPVQMLFRWAVRKHRVPANPASDLDHPRPIQKLPVALSPDQVERILAQPDVGTSLGLRDRAMMEVLYATGIRRAELAHLRVEDVDAQQGIVRVVQGKGQKDRLVPIGGRALHWVRRWLDEARPGLALPDTRALLLSQRGIGIVPGDLTPLVGRYVRRSGVARHGSCHLFRHAMATALHNAGCDIRLVQAMLGHAKLDTTALYTHVGIANLQAAHAAFHPAADLGEAYACGDVDACGDANADAQDAGSDA